MRILIFGASGVLGRATLSHLAGHTVAGTTRSRDKLPLLAERGVQGLVCDAYDAVAAAACARGFAPDVVVNFLTDLSGGPGPATSRLRREACPNVTAAARAAGAQRLVVESIAFRASSPESAAAVTLMEADALESGLPALVLRFGLFWGPGTWYGAPPRPPAIEIGEAGRRAAALIIGDDTGIQVVADG
jgi:nucleoside-diphosphate-sugar epimerase